MKSKLCALLLAADSLVAVSLIVIGAPLAYGESMGSGSLLDRRVQTAVYSPDQVYRIQAGIGRSSLVQFPANETVNETSGLIVSGDPTAWTIGANKAGNIVAIKPSTDLEPNTNLMINTNKRTYLLELKLVKRPEDMTYALRFTFPEPPKPIAPARNTPVNPCAGPIQNGPYQRRGEMSISPSEGWDNGMLTCFRFATNAPRPVLYQVLADGTETLADTHNEQNVLVVHGVSQLFRFRLNGMVLEAKPKHVVSTGYNFNGTTTGEIRELKHADQ